MSDITVYYNPRCSKCRTTGGLLDEAGVDWDEYRYLDQAPGRDEIERVMGLLGIEDPRQMMRTGEDVYQELGLADADAEGDALIDSMVEHPILIERPIVIRGDRAVIGRPPENVRRLLD